MIFSRKLVFIAIGPFLFCLLLLLGPPEGMAYSAYMALASTVWIASWWVTEAIPIPATSLLPLVLFPLTGVMTMKETTAPYASPIIYLFLGGFLMALAMERWNLHRRIALSLIAMVGTNMRQILLGFILATGFLSMWISNTATTLMMLPIAISVIGQFETFSAKDSFDHPGASSFGKALILSIAYSASIGGMATLVGTPTNLIFANAVKDTYGSESQLNLPQMDIAFDQWMWFGLPVSLLLLGVCWWHLSHNAFKLGTTKVEGSKAIINSELAQLGKMKLEEKWVLAIFSLVALGWITRRYLITPFFPAVDDTNIVMVGALLMFVVPSKSQPNTFLMDWKTALKLPWGVLLLFGGAFAVAAAFETSGLTAWIGEQLKLLKGIPFWLILLIVITTVNFLTEITQNIATCTLMLPIMAALSGVIDAHPFGLMAGTCIAASCAFMLPVATAPNAVVFGSGHITMKDMVRAGFLLNILSVIVILLATYFLLPLLWGIDMQSFPAVLRR